MTIKLGTTDINKIVLGEEPSDGPTLEVTLPWTPVSNTRLYSDLEIGESYTVTFTPEPDLILGPSSGDNSYGFLVSPGVNTFTATSTELWCHSSFSGTPVNISIVKN